MSVVATVVALLSTLFHPTLSIIISGDCEARCLESRPMGFIHAYKFECDAAYKTEETRKKCRDSCESCPEAVCDETFDDNKWHCPSVNLSSFCENACYQHRPKGTQRNYTLACDTAYTTQTERNLCHQDCGSCPSFICKNNNQFHCPSTTFAGVCEEECDARRGIGEVEPIEFDCIFYGSNRSLSSSRQLDECQSRCSSCPKWVCDPKKNTNRYSCPPFQLAEECRKICEDNRVVAVDGLEKYLLDCKRVYNSTPGAGWERACSVQCENCVPGSFEGEPFCRLPKPRIFFCPPKILDLPVVEEPTTKPSYKGRCSEKCEANRGGGFGDFVIDCSTRYDTVEEVTRCKQICQNECPSDACEAGTRIKCRDRPKQTQEKLKKEHKLLAKVEQLEKQHEEHVLETKELKAELQRQSAQFNNLVLWGVLGFLFFFSCCIGGMCYFAKRKPKIKTGVTGLVHLDPVEGPTPQEAEAANQKRLQEGLPDGFYFEEASKVKPQMSISSYTSRTSKASRASSRASSNLLPSSNRSSMQPPLDSY